MCIITINREFGSGGRELAKRLADVLGFAYFDKEIISMVAKKSNLSEDYLECITTKTNEFPYTIGKSFTLYSTPQKYFTNMLVTERKIIQEIAKQGNCVIVGRGADVILREFNTVNIFVYSNLNSKLKRCKEKASANENLNEKELIKKIKLVDKQRKKFYLLLGLDSWGEKENYDICINTTNVEIKDVVPQLAELTKRYLGE